MPRPQVEHFHALFTDPNPLPRNPALLDHWRRTKVTLALPAVPAHAPTHAPQVRGAPGRPGLSPTVSPPPPLAQRPHDHPPPLQETAIESHPVLALIPEVDEQDLQTLIDSIRSDGLFQPIVRDSRGRILDGRARLRACTSLQLEPRFTTFDGSDSGGYALTVNLQRRSLTKGQSAMIAARACSSDEHQLRSLGELTARSLSEQAGVSLGRIGQANTVLRIAPDLVDSVIAGALGLNEAYTEAKQRKNRANTADAQLERLRKDDPALADRVVEGELTLAGALAERAARVEEEARQRHACTQLLCQTVTPLAKTLATNAFQQYDPALAPPEQAVTRERIAQAIAALQAMDEVWRERGLA